jgi:hypothetical protein
LIVNFSSLATDTLDFGIARLRARANSSVKAGGVSISAPSAPQSATIANSTPSSGLMPPPKLWFNPFGDQVSAQAMMPRPRATLR